MNERDFEVGGKQYRLSKIDAFKQFHIVRRLGPILGDIIPVAQKMKSAMREDASEEEKFDQIAKVLTPIMTGLSKLSDQDANTVLIGLLCGVEVKQPTGWAKMAVGENIMMSEGLELPLMLQLAGRAFGYNLSGFFALAPQVSHGGR